ncbi:uncharacterized protein LOC125101693 [Lutra lutra]|uniref:uncharacterized protein LOC125101693 n=1 Tax=Lutra lutra TaxID=9657 RepID=UPI001FD1EF87|nr:uncharacterized protein LOC125101693 [Lutra lutra]
MLSNSSSCTQPAACTPPAPHGPVSLMAASPRLPGTARRCHTASAISRTTGLDFSVHKFILQLWSPEAHIAPLRHDDVTVRELLLVPGVQHVLPRSPAPAAAPRVPQLFLLLTPREPSCFSAAFVCGAISFSWHEEYPGLLHAHTVAMCGDYGAAAGLQTEAAAVGALDIIPGSAGCPGSCGLRPCCIFLQNSLEFHRISCLCRVNGRASKQTVNSCCNRLEILSAYHMPGMVSGSGEAKRKRQDDRCKVVGWDVNLEGGRGSSPSALLRRQRPYVSLRHIAVPTAA